MRMSLAAVIQAAVMLAVALGVALLALSRPPGSASDDAGSAAVPRLAADPQWAASVAELEQALTTGDARRAFAVWPDVRERALRSRDWQVQASAGESAMRLATLAGPPQVMREEARRLYLRALLQARTQRSAEGIHEVADAFARLGDTEAAASARRMAEALR